ncbi:putative cinnamoyl-CoA reductase [Daldinia caldariorum]|uniref:putative cinnamoyl-CoA reductase n=1 Tax=Daldinia caldariorum TaxID=326644 RepID=UPI002007A90D|nr:putative cinnamoyl-CoA reductase [Daldinia caldariorum]KAI1463440.1 putative cinnamoyl-CoA reductase [Daldinia caldariorum]
MAATILITGSTGLIGFSILLAALDAGHNVRYTVRSEEKAKVVSSNPAVQKRAPGERLSPVIIPDLAADGAFDSAVQGITHIIHAGSPVPVPTYDPNTQIYQPTVNISKGLLASALKAPSVKRVIITSSIVANLGPVPPPATVSATTRVPLPNPIPSTFSNVFEAYVMGKIVELRNSDELVETQNPHFTVSHVVPGYVFGRNELVLDADMMHTQNSSNNFLMLGLQGGEPPFPVHGGFAHIDDVADAHLRVAFLDPKPDEPKDFGIAAKVNYDNIFDYVARAFPKAVEEGIFKKGKIQTIPINYDSSDVEKLLGGKLRTFESAVVDVAAQYLEKLGKEKA